MASTFNSPVTGRVSHRGDEVTATLDLAKTPLTDERLHNDAGAYYRIVFISANNLSPDLSPGEVKVLATAIEKQNLNLMIGEAHRENDGSQA